LYGTATAGAAGIVAQQVCHRSPGGELVGELSISLPGELEEFVADQAAGDEYTSAGDYVRDLIRHHKEAKEHLQALLLEGLGSGPSEPPDPNYFDDLRTRVRQG
jgi:antitoxin ParD1/3/4